MPPRNRRLPVVGGAIGAILVLVLVALFSGTASAAAAPAPTASTPSTQTVTFDKVWHGVGTHKPARSPDVMVLPSPPAGVWWEITKIQLTAHYVDKKTFRQTNFLFSRTVQNPTTYPHLADPNLDSLAHVGLNPGKTGTYIGAGGTGASPNKSWDWIEFDQPIRLNSEIQIVLGSSMGVGNWVEVNVEYKVLGSGQTIVKYAHPSMDGHTVTFKIGGVPAGKEWYLMNAYGDIQAGSGSGGRAIQMKTSTGTLLVSGHDFPVHISVRCTGGYSTRQTGPALNNYGTQVVWTSQVWLSGSEYITVQFTGLSSDHAMYALVFEQVG